MIDEVLDNIIAYVIDVAVHLGIAAAQVLIALMIMVGGLGLIDYIPHVEADLSLFLDEFILPLFVLGMAISLGASVFLKMINW